jgi:hypothetical protein
MVQMGMGMAMALMASGAVQVSELHKIPLFIYIPWTKSGFLTYAGFTYTLTGLFTNNVFSFYALSYSDTSRAGRSGGPIRRTTT